MDSEAKEDSRSRAIPLWLVLLLPALAYLVATGLDYGSQAVNGPDEPRYAAAAREMIRGGDWLVPHFNGRVRLEKPILLYWSCGFFSLIFGVGPLACRLGPVLAGLGTVLVTAGLASRIYGRRAGLLAGMILSTTWFFPQVGRTVLTDMPLTFFTVAAVALMRVSLEETAWTRRRKLLLFAAYLLCSMGVLTKGPVGLFLPLAIMACWLGWAGRPFSFVGVLPLSGTLTTSLVAGPWYLAVYLRGGEAREGLREFFGHENFDRMFHSFDHIDVPWKYVTTSVPQGMMPWTMLLPAGLLAFWWLGRRPAPPGKAAETTEVTFPAMWAAAVVGVFSASGQLGVWPWVVLCGVLFVVLAVLFMRGKERYWKWIALASFSVFALVVGYVPAGGGEPGGTTRSFYVLAAYPALAMAAAWAIDRLLSAGSEEVRWSRRLVLAVPALCATALLVVGGVVAVERFAPESSPLVKPIPDFVRSVFSGAPLLDRPVPNIDEYRALPGYSTLCWLLLCGCTVSGAAALALLVARRRLAAFVAVALGISTVQGCYWGGAIPMRDRLAGIESFYAKIGAAMTDAEAPVISYDLPSYAEAVYHLDRPVARLSHKARGGATLKEVMVAKRPRYLIIRRKHFKRHRELFAGRGRVLVGRADRKRKSYALLAIDWPEVANQPAANPDNGS